MKTKVAKKNLLDERDAHELLQQDDLRWLADFREVLSPYWASRFQYPTTSRAPVIEIVGRLPKEGAYHEAA